MNKRIIAWIKCPIIELPEPVAYYLSKQDLFIRYTNYSGRGRTYAECANWVADRLMEGELGIFMGYRIITKQK